MQRMGIVTDYFETIVSRRELDDWRMKEDICLLAFEKPDEAMEKLEQYQENCLKGKNGVYQIQEQFCIKIKWILLRKVLKAEQLYKLASDASFLHSYRRKLEGEARQFICGSGRIRSNASCGLVIVSSRK